MSMEGPPAPPPEKKETEPGSYEHALELFKNLKEEGLKNPLDQDSPKVKEAQDELEEWERRAGIMDMTAGIGGLERAKELVRSARLLLEAGFTGKSVRSDAKERLDDLYALAQRENNPDVAAYIDGELEKLEPKSGLEKKLEAKLAEAAAAPRPIDAVGILTFVLIDPRFKRMSAEQRVRIEQARDGYK